MSLFKPMNSPRRLILLPLIALLHASLFSTVAAAQFVPVPGMFNTGVDGNGGVLATGTPDLNYPMTSGGTAVAIDRHPNWVIPPPGSKWIGIPNGNITALPGNYVYEMTFDLTGFDPQNARLGFKAAADWQVTVRLNGHYLTNACCSSVGLTSQFTSNYFVAGVNTLEFLVENLLSYSTPSGLLIADTWLEAYPSPSPVLSVITLTAGAPALISVDYVTPGSLVALAFSRAGTGPTSYLSATCGWAFSLSLSNPIGQLGVATAINLQNIGVAGFTPFVPVAAAGMQVHFQALAFDTCELTNVVSTFVQ